MFIGTAIVSTLLALALMGSAGGKLTKQPPVVKMLSGIGVPSSWLPRLAAVELAGGIGLLVGLAVPAIGIAAAVGVAAYFVGAVITHLRANDKAIAAPVMIGIFAVVALVLRAATI
ncbi:MAG: DoxX family protein [Actinobacteria bacterium]|nr:DoxX family protein [Actinomycetota bacterium]